MNGVLVEALAAYDAAEERLTRAYTSDIRGSAQRRMDEEALREAIVNLATAARAALALPAQAAADAAGVLRLAEQATMHYYREVEAICKDDTRRDELPVAKARYRAVEDLYQEMRRALADALEVQG